jgi:murein DD-endopeptidase MepM/ murein hydrolase activator NlpD
MNQSVFDLGDRAIAADISLRTPSRPLSRASGLILADASALAARETTSRDGGIPDLGTRLYPPMKGFSPARITSPFGIRASNGRRHDGVDIKAKSGEEILAAASGMVAFS